ncbi:MAG: elongation factor Ts [Acidobacteriaceae bacterium]|nr:elongation factor Ts [Acidobacteriaceae bacterium]MBV9778771.1 elongation factor Ts [Acidobacteriaceae bacterium]
MADITPEMVKRLRERTGAGIMDCKRALVAANGDMAEAEVILRKQGIASASKKESRSTKQGLIGSFISPDGKLGVLVEVNCESDFVARTEDFQQLTADVAAHIAETKPKVVRIDEVTEAERANFRKHHALYEQKFAKDQDTTVGELVRTKIAKLGENIAVSRFIVFEVNGHGIAGNYIHTGGQIGALLELRTNSDEVVRKPEFQALVRDIAMQIAAAAPQWVSKADVPASLLEKEREIQRDRVRNEGKPEKMLDKIAEGRMSKFYEEVCLLEQPFIRENTTSVADLIKSVSGKLGDNIEVSRFVRYKVGDAMDVPGVQESPLPVTA